MLFGDYFKKMRVVQQLPMLYEVFFVHFKDSKKRSFISKLPQNFFDSFCKFKIYEVKSKK